MLGMSDDFRLRGEQLQQLAKYQQAQRLAALTAHVNAVLAGETPETPVQPAQTARSYTRRLALFCVLYAIAGVTVGLAIGRALWC